MDLEQLKATAAQELRKHGLHGWTFGLADAKRRLGVCKYRTKRIEIAEYYARHSPEESVLDTLRHEIAHALAGPAAKHGPRWKAVAVRLGATPRSCETLGPGRRAARRLAGDLPGVREDLPPLPAAEEPDRLPLQVRGPLAADVRVHGRPGPQARRAADRPGVGELGGDVCGLRDGASAAPQAEGGRLAVQVPPPLRDRLAAPVWMTATLLPVRPEAFNHRLERLSWRAVFPLPARRNRRQQDLVEPEAEVEGRQIALGQQELRLGDQFVHASP